MDAADSTAALVRGNGAFALDVYRRLSAGDGNRFLSPFSISAAALSRLCEAIRPGPALFPAGTTTWGTLETSTTSGRGAIIAVRC